MDRRKATEPQMTQPERAFWRDVFCAVIAGEAINVAQAAEVADAAVQEYRNRILWRDRK